MPPLQKPFMNSRWKIPATVGLILINIAVFIFTWLQAGSLDGPRWIVTLLRAVQSAHAG